MQNNFEIKKVFDSISGARLAEMNLPSTKYVRRLINHSINDDIFVNAKSSKKEQHQVYLSDEIKRLSTPNMQQRMIYHLLIVGRNESYISVLFL